MRHYRVYTIGVLNTDLLKIKVMAKKELKLTCIVCKREFKIPVEEKDLRKYEGGGYMSKMHFLI